jgi:hypothetical protein
MVRKFIRDFIEQELGPDWREQVLESESHNS